MAEENKEAEASAGAPAAAGSGGGGPSKLLLILTAVNMLATVGIIAILFISFKKEATKPSVEDIVAHEEHGEEGAEGGHGGGDKKGAKEDESHQFGKMIPLELFTVNLSTVGSVNPKYARVNISVEVPNTDVETEITSKMPQVRNAIIDLFNSKKPTDLATTEGRNYLKEEIQNALNSFLVTGKVTGVFFTSFAVSS